MACCFRFTQYLVALCLLLSLGLFVTAGAVNYWWVTDLSEKGKQHLFVCLFVCLFVFDYTEYTSYAKNQTSRMEYLDN